MKWSKLEYNTVQILSVVNNPTHIEFFFFNVGGSYDKHLPTTGNCIFRKKGVKDVASRVPCVFMLGRQERERERQGGGRDAEHDLQLELNLVYHGNCFGVPLLSSLSPHFVTAVKMSW